MPQMLNTLPNTTQHYPHNPHPPPSPMPPPHTLSLDPDQMGQVLGDKIKKDTNRTFKRNPEFQRRVPEEKLIRVLNAYVNQRRRRIRKREERLEREEREARAGRGSVSGGGGTRMRKRAQMPDHYVQGMNVLCAPFLYVMPEVDAFYSFSNLLTIHAPRYAQPNLDGAHLGCNLCDAILKHVDADLYVTKPSYYTLYTPCIHPL